MTQPNIIPMSDTSATITIEDVSPTVLPDAFLASETAQSIGAFHLPRYEELPRVPLYREQVISYVEQVLAPLNGIVEGPWLTPSMVNNYVKIGLVAPPVKKLYRTEQIARLIVICIFKQVLPIAAVSRLFRIQMMSYWATTAYDYTATELEHALASAFSAEQTSFADTASRVTRESLLVRNAVTAFAARALLMGYLGFLGFEDEPVSR